MEVRDRNVDVALLESGLQVLDVVAAVVEDWSEGMQTRRTHQLGLALMCI